jgi:hypothetical protein
MYQHSVSLEEITLSSLNHPKWDTCPSLLSSFLFYFLSPFSPSVSVDSPFPFSSSLLLFFLLPSSLLLPRTTPDLFPFLLHARSSLTLPLPSLFLFLLFSSSSLLCRCTTTALLLFFSSSPFLSFGRPNSSNPTPFLSISFLLFLFPPSLLCCSSRRDGARVRVLPRGRDFCRKLREAELQKFQGKISLLS